MPAEPAGKGVDGDPRLLDVLERWFLAEAEGDASDLEALCAGDPVLAARVRELLDSEPEAVRRAASDEDGTNGSASEEGGDDELPARRLGEFRLLELLGRGGMGTVFLAEQETLGRRVALKVLDPLAVRDARSRQRFRREAEVAAGLEHPHIVPIYGVGEADGYPFLAMKRLSGPSLDALAEPLTPREVARIGAAVARALDEAHLSGVIHRDVKPANVILDGDRPYVVDFGLARSQTDHTLTKQGAVPGTLPYMAPELLRIGATALDPRTDVYALGATLYELIAGRPPFSGDTSEALVRQIALKEPPALHLSGAERDLETIVLRALEKDPARRFPSALALAEDLERWLRGEAIGSKRAGVLSRSWKLARRHRKATAFSGSIALVAAVLLALLLVTEARARAGREHNVELAREALAAGEHAAAARILRSVRPADDDTRALLERAEAEGTIEQLLDAILAFPVSVDHAALDRLVDEIARTDALRHRPRIGRIALAVAAHHRGTPDVALARLSELDEPGRAGAAVARVLDGGGPLPPAATTRTADEHVLTALAMLLAGDPLDVQEREVSRAFEADPACRRAHYVRAMGHIAAGRFREARLVLDGLVEGDATPRYVWRNLASCMIAENALAEARATLARIPDEEWTSLEAHVRLRSYWQARDWAGFEERVEADLARWPQASPLLRAAAEYRGLVGGDLDEALRLIDEAARTASDPFNASEAETVRFLLDTVGRRGEGADTEAGARIDEGHALLERVTLPDDRTRVEYALGHLYLREGQLARGLEHLRAAASVSSSFGVQARVDYVMAVHDQLALGERPFHEVLYLVSEARPYLEQLLARLDEGTLALEDELRFRLELAAIGFAIQQNDFALLEARLPDLLPRIEPAETRQRLADELERIRRTRAAVFDD